MGAPSTAYVKQYQATITILAQQMDSRLKDSVLVDTNWTGEEKYYDQYNTDTMVEISARFADTPVQEGNHARRKVTPRYYVSNTLEDPNEVMAMLVDPKSTYMQAKHAAANRKIDETIITALGGTSYSGKAGGTSNTLASANKVVAGGAGLTKAKILDAKKILDAYEVPIEGRTMVAASAQFNLDVLSTTEVGSSDFNTIRALVQGEIKTWLGFTWVRSEQLAVDGSDARLCYAFQKNGLQLAFQKTPEGKITERPDKNYAWQVYLRVALGAVRLDEKNVVQIACTEA